MRFGVHGRGADIARWSKQSCAACLGADPIAKTPPPLNGERKDSVTGRAAVPSKSPGALQRQAAQSVSNKNSNSEAKSRIGKRTEPTERLTQEQLFAGFTGTFRRPRVRIFYRLGLVLVALTMITLPLIYLSFIAGIGLGVYYHAVNHTALLEFGSGRARLLSASLYLAPFVAGPIAAFFMFKPLFARPSSKERYRSLTRQSEPLLFAFVDRLCETVGAPQPKRIDVDCQVNASAGFRRGVLSMLGSDLVLTIGLPLAAGLSLREFGGVLAHEFGHFAQGAGMRLTYLIRSIVGWFIRVVYQRDQWDEWLESTAQELDFRIGWILVVAQLFVMIGRGLLWLLFHIGLAISGVMLRQMEYDADRYETQFAGSTAFANTARKLHLLNGGLQFAQLQLSHSLDHRKLVDNLPGLIVYHARQLSGDGLPQIEKMLAEGRTGWFDSHPCDRERIAAAEKLASPGIFQLDRPAADLFSDFHAQAAAGTWDLYLGLFGPKVPRTALQPIREYLATFSK